MMHDEVYTYNNHEYNPPGALIIFMNEWEDYGTCGYGDVNGQPLRTGDYYSWDEYGEDPVDGSLLKCLAATIEDERLRRKVCQQVLAWIWDNATEVVFSARLQELIET